MDFHFFSYLFQFCHLWWHKQSKRCLPEPKESQMRWTNRHKRFWLYPCLLPDKNWKLLKKPQVNKRWSSQYYFHYEVRKERKLLSYTESLFSFLTNNLASCKVARNIFPFFLISKLIDCGHQTMTRLISKAFLMKRPIDFCWVTSVFQSKRIWIRNLKIVFIQNLLVCANHHFSFLEV